MSPKEYIGTSGSANNEMYAMTDDVSDTEFETALDAATEERNLSRDLQQVYQSGTPEPAAPAPAWAGQDRQFDEPAKPVAPAHAWGRVEGPATGLDL